MHHGIVYISRLFHINDITMKIILGLFSLVVVRLKQKSKPVVQAGAGLVRDTVNIWQESWEDGKLTEKEARKIITTACDGVEGLAVEIVKVLYSLKL